MDQLGGGVNSLQYDPILKRVYTASRDSIILNSSYFQEKADNTFIVSYLVIN